MEISYHRFHDSGLPLGSSVNARVQSSAVGIEESSDGPLQLPMHPGNLEGFIELIFKHNPYKAVNLGNNT
jgi:hypothetical protein